MGKDKKKIPVTNSCENERSINKYINRYIWKIYTGIFHIAMKDLYLVCKIHFYGSAKNRQEIQFIQGKNVMYLGPDLIMWLEILIYLILTINLRDKSLVSSSVKKQRHRESSNHPESHSLLRWVQILSFKNWSIIPHLKKQERNEQRL